MTYRRCTKQPSGSELADIVHINVSDDLMPRFNAGSVDASFDKMLDMVAGFPTASNSAPFFLLQNHRLPPHPHQRHLLKICPTRTMYRAHSRYTSSAILHALYCTVMPSMNALLIHLSIHAEFRGIVGMHSVEPVRNASLSRGKNTPGVDALRAWGTVSAPPRTVPVIESCIWSKMVYRAGLSTYFVQI